MKNLLKRFINEEEGQDLIEYALLAGLIALACVVALTATGTNLNTLWTSVNDAVATAAS